MLNLTASTKIYFCRQPTDMRRSFDGLCGMVQQVLQQDILSGHLFLFYNRRRDRLKILYWDRDGLAIWYKRLEKGTFQLPSECSSTIANSISDPNSDPNSEQNGEQAQVASPPGGVEIPASELALILEGVDLKSVRRRPRWYGPQNASPSK